jgi:hypothetical protein
MKDISIGKKKFLCKVAGLVYEVEYQYPYTKKKFKDYLIDSSDVNQEIIRITYDSKDLEEVLKLAPGVSGGYQEYACIFDKIASGLLEQEMILMHGALIEYEGDGFIFTAPSGTGKTTHIVLWRKYLGEKVVIVNGDKPELAIEDDSVVAYGTPWCGSEGWQVNKSVPLKGICFIRRGTENRIKEISPGEYIEHLIQQFYFDIRSGEMPKVLEFINKIVERVPFYLLECDISEEAAKCSFEKMTGKEWRKQYEN